MDHTRYVVAAGFTGKLFVAAAFLITCLLAFATGTSVGTYFVVIPILFPVGVMAGAAPEFMIGAIVSGAAFGDNLGPISDTTIASSATQHADLGTVVKTRTRYSLPAAAGALLLFLLFSRTADGGPAVGTEDSPVNPASLIMLIVPVAIVALGDLINEIGEKAGVNRYRRANLMDCTGCVFCFLAPWTVHCVIPAQLSA